MSAGDFSTDYLSLRAANDLVREKGKEWLFESLSGLCSETGPETQIARQPWQFEVGRSVMVGERFGIRNRGRTLVVEIGWPREPAHGFVPDQGLARGRISLSASPMLSPRLLEEIILKTALPKAALNDAMWYSIDSGRIGGQITLEALRQHVKAMLDS
jgi:hypothetical protein